MKKYVRLALATVAGGAALVATASPAAAAGTKCYASLLGTSQVEVCVTVGPYGGTYGTLQAYNGSFGNYVLAVEQCRTDMTNCVQFSAQSYPYGGITYASNPSKYCSFGHVYRTRASWTDDRSGQRFLDVRTPWSACS